MRTCYFSSVGTSGVPDLDPIGSDILIGYQDPAKGFRFRIQFVMLHVQSLLSFRKRNCKNQRVYLSKCRGITAESFWKCLLGHNFNKVDNFSSYLLPKSRIRIYRISLITDTRIQFRICTIIATGSE
jgi:hypothetical protein